MPVTSGAVHAHGLSDCLDGQAPLAVRAIDLDGPMPAYKLPLSRTGVPYLELLALLRRYGEPLGWVSLPVGPDGEVSGQALAELAGPPAPVGLLAGLEPSAPAMQRAPVEASLSVVVTTCANATLVIRCVEAILASALAPMEVIVVENRPAASTVGTALEQRFAGDRRVLYVEEAARGLSHARNAGLRAARGALVAFTDDDIIVDARWTVSLVQAFAAMGDVDAVMGLILPLELETPSQVLVERFVSFGKGFLPRVYSLDDPPLDQPLFPYTAGYFGSGANMAFKADALREIGGFDPALGAGTRARGGEDLDIGIRLLHSGRRLAYEPRAMVWHRHPDSPAQLRRQVLAYGVGLGAMLTKQLVVGPNRGQILMRVPLGVRYFLDPTSRKNALRGSAFPRRLSLLERLGLLWGPFAYLASRLRRGR